MKIKFLSFLTVIALLPQLANATSKPSAADIGINANDIQLKSSIGQKRELMADKKVKLEQEYSVEETLQQIQNYMNAASNWKKLKCVPKSGFICTKRECNKKEIKTWLILDKKKETVSRCENETNCVVYDAEFSQSGVNINIQGDKPIGSMVKVLGDNRYKEIVTIGLDAYIANGECEVVN